MNAVGTREVIGALIIMGSIIGSTIAAVAWMNANYMTKDEAKSSNLEIMIKIDMMYIDQLDSKIERKIPLTSGELTRYEIRKDLVKTNMKKRAELIGL